MKASGFGALIALALGILALAPLAAQAATINVTRFDDAPFNGCAVSGCTLREAVSQARNAAGSDTIVLQAGTYRLTIGPDNGVNSNVNGDLDYADIGPEPLGDLTIRGQGPARTTIDATGLNDRILQVFGDGFLTTIEGVRMAGGSATTAADLFDGGAVWLGANSPTTFRRVVIAGNHSRDHGGGLATFSGSTNLSQVTFAGNEADNNGGAIWSTATAGGPAVHLVNSTLSGNQAFEGGGGIAVWGDGAGLPDPVLRVTNSTIANNRASGWGGGIDNFAGAATHLETVTLARNTADADNNASGLGGGIQNDALGSVKNSVIVFNALGSEVPNDCNGNFNSLGGNVLQSSTGCNGFNAAGDIFRPDPRIGQLADNGGPTRTIALLPGSPAIDHTTGCLAFEQRGIDRGLDPDGRCDSGAYERVLCGGVAVNRFGAKGRNLLVGTPGRDGILGFGGNDVIRGRGGRDGLCGGAGRDRLFGGKGPDRLRGGKGRDRLSGGPGRDRLLGGPGRDILRGGPGRDRLLGGPGIDRLRQ